MYNTSKKTTWYGELRTSRGNTIVIHDKQFPEASAGRVYFYNTTRDAIIEYAEEIVQANLHELDDDAIKAAEAAYGSAWNVKREAFMEKHQGWVEANTTKSSPAPKKPKPEAIVEPEAELESESESLDGNYDSDWPTDDYDD